jgi:uncharacterized repeat protein (TIGR03803 family)
VGTVFELSPGETGWTETILHSFSPDDSDNPETGVIMDSVGNLYGTTIFGGVYDDGTVFEMSPTVGGGWAFQVLYSSPEYYYEVISGLTIDAAGNLYGATFSTVYELSPDGNGDWNPTLIHAFPGGYGGTDTEDAPVFDNAGTFT